MGNKMKSCVTCKYVHAPWGFSPSVWDCLSPANGIDPVSGKPKKVWCSHKNEGNCPDWEPRVTWAEKLLDLYHRALATIKGWDKK